MDILDIFAIHDIQYFLLSLLPAPHSLRASLCYSMFHKQAPATRGPLLDFIYPPYYHLLPFAKKRENPLKTLMSEWSNPATSLNGKILENDDRLTPFPLVTSDNLQY